MASSTGDIIVTKPISSQLIDHWIVCASHQEFYGSFKTMEDAIKFAHNFDYARVAPVYWATTNRG